MVTRRDFVAGSIAAAALARVPSALAKPSQPSQPSTPVNFDVPRGACDCHTHIHAPQFPWYEGSDSDLRWGSLNPTLTRIFSRL